MSDRPWLDVVARLARRGVYLTDLEALASGTAVIVPVEPAMSVLLKGLEAACYAFYEREGVPVVGLSTDDILAAHKKMLASRPKTGEGS